MSIQVLNSRILVITQRKVVEGKDVIHAPPGGAVIKYPIQRVDITTAATDDGTLPQRGVDGILSILPFLQEHQVFFYPEPLNGKFQNHFNLEITISPNTKARRPKTVHTGLS